MEQINKSLISVIVPIFKVESYLGKCIDSILSQTYKNIEIILVDDGSPDSCPQICDLYSEKDNRIKVIHKNNGGLSDARNAGLIVSKGEYVCFVDGDDFVETEYVERLYTAIKKCNADLAICGFKYVDEKYNGLWRGESPINNEILDRDSFFSKII